MVGGAGFGDRGVGRCVFGDGAVVQGGVAVVDSGTEVLVAAYAEAGEGDVRCRDAELVGGFLLDGGSDKGCGRVVVLLDFLVRSL